ncbi:hypothetical protein F444_17381 [Phytophthora nicotianae P1976]|uniref:EGF-like domain-containing protein n=1 Tax=Phytophthora nicotianae P1976 TaxID=1317066 RepID=A0A080ZF88_PHYNI|nr:hypothetical protein F444_17381 [Phytophthora nicotianae P1976]
MIAPWYVLIVMLLVAISTSQATEVNSSDVTLAPLSGCQVCANTGDCSHAYLDGPGQFCGNWMDRASQRQRCCCPREAMCAVSNYVCNCKTNKTKAPTTSVSTSSSSSRASWSTIFGSIILMFAASAILWFLCPCCRANKYAALSKPAMIPMTPVVVQAPYAHGYVNTYAPGYAPGPVYGGPVYGGYSNGGMGAGSSAMLGGVAGMFGGILAGQALSNAGEYHGYHGGDETCIGGEEFGGDF